MEVMHMVFQDKLADKLGEDTSTNMYLCMTFRNVIMQVSPGIDFVRQPQKNNDIV